MRPSDPPFPLNLQKGNQVRPIDIATRFEVSEKTARRDVKRLREHEVVKYVGSRKTGHYQLKGTDE
jgi:Mn-dependent DtxR family transcriptional regulator